MQLKTMVRAAAMVGLALVGTDAAAQRETTLINDNWKFHLGDASSMEADFGHGTEYFTYFSKAVGQNQGPANPEFNDSTWTAVTLPHDWVVDLPYASEASHSHGYKQVGWKYPQTSIGWYRHHFIIDAKDEGRDIYVTFEGIFRDAQVFCNGFYMGHEVSGYARQVYNISEYVNYGGDNVLTVRCNAMTEEGWYYEGAGIYRDVWLTKRDKAHHIDDVFAIWDGEKLNIESRATGAVRHQLIDATGAVVAEGGDGAMKVGDAKLWSPETPYLYTLRTSVSADGQERDAVTTKIGLRTLEWSVGSGLKINGKETELVGSNLHLDHAGVGVGVLKELWAYKVKKLKELGMNAIRLSHNPGTPAMLDVCDSLGMVVIDENRLMGTNDEHLRLLRSMIERDRNHPSVILWSIGNEEWWIESGDKGEKIARVMSDYAHKIDPSRKTTYGNSGGFGLVKQVDIHGYNYIVQNDVQNRREKYPDWVVVGTEETSGCGTRGVYATDSVMGWMKSINQEGEERSDGEKNVIGRGWKFYRDNKWAAGLFYWTGFDYRGEPNPMKWPATGSQFGILDYCGFPKDEAYYLKAAWTQEPVLHILPHWNLGKEMEDKEVEVWCYTNMDEVELLQDGKSLGRKKMEKGGYAAWRTTYKPGRLEARGFVGGKRKTVSRIETTGAATSVELEASRATIGGTQDCVVVDVTLRDKKGRFAVDACDKLTVSVEGDAEILGWGNGDPGYKASERPQGEDKKHAELKAFMGHAQVILRGVMGIRPVTVKIALPSGEASSVALGKK
ncbi:MAG: glycoside hydrolase family 2 TIM barrel-domain containing protein [Bacteroidales bacterium]|nr:glycoside hydrolase family 2 TIM barrel-domain containing protein [Bacteroidales bacterium]